MRQKARETLTVIGRQAVGHLIPLLKDPEDDVRWEAAKALADIADVRAASELVATLEDSNFGVRWLAAEGLIAIGRDVLPSLDGGPHKTFRFGLAAEGAHHVLHDLANRDPEVKDFVAPVITALEGSEPEVGVMELAHTALDKLEGQGKA